LGALQEDVCQEDRSVTYLTRKGRDDRYDLNQLRTVPWMPNQDERRMIKMSWSVASKAAERSSRQRHDNFLWSCCTESTDEVIVDVQKSCFGRMMFASHHSVFFIVRMPFLPPNQQHQSTEGRSTILYITDSVVYLPKVSMAQWMEMSTRLHSWLLLMCCCRICSYSYTCSIGIYTEYCFFCQCWLSWQPDEVM